MYSKLSIQATSLLLNITADSKLFFELDEQDIFSMTERIASQIRHFLSVEKYSMTANEQVIMSLDFATMLTNLLIKYRYDENFRVPDLMLNQINEYLIQHR